MNNTHQGNQIPEPMVDNCWKDFQLSVGEGIWLHFGERAIGICRREEHWRFHSIPKDPPFEPEQPAMMLLKQTDESQFDIDCCRQRSFSLDNSRIRLRPALPDRDVIASPITPITLTSGAKVTLYISLPLWLSIEQPCNDTPLVLFETPIFRPSDTWFGSNTQTGRLAYASQTNARVHIAELPLRQYRAVTPLHLAYHGENSIPFSRLAIPAPRLSLFAASDGMLWTNEVSMTLKHEQDNITVKLGDAAPHEAGHDCQLLTTPRISSVMEDWISTFDKWVGRMT